MTKLALRTTAVATALIIGLAAGPAVAQDLSSSISCLRGNVQANDYAEFGAKLSETNWDSKGGVNLLSNIGGLKLRVLDPNGSSVCSETANNTTSCTFKVRNTYYDEFTVIVDNAEVAEQNGYKICAF